MMKKLFKYFILLISVLKADNSFSISVYDARRLPTGSQFTVSGTALNGNEFGNQRFITDGTSAICIFSSLVSSVNAGDHITVTGTLDEYHNLLEVVNLTSLNINSTGNALPSPEILFPHQARESYEGDIVQLRNVTINATGFFSGNTAYEFSDGSGTSVLYIKTGTSLVGQPVPQGAVTITGICGQYDDLYEIFPRSISDLHSEPLYITASPQISGITASGFTVNWETNGVSSTTLRYGNTPLLELGLLNGSSGVTNHTQQITGSASELFYFQCVSYSGSDSAVSPVMSGITAATSGSISVYFNRSINASVASPSNNIAHYTTSFQDTIASFINSAQQTIDICIYSFSSFNTSAIVSAINNAYSAGKQVRIIYDPNATSAVMQQINASIPRLASPVTDNNYNICHNKFIIRDASTANGAVLCGSTNFTNGQMNDDANNIVICRDQSAAKIYTMEFEEMWGSSTATPDLTKNRFGYYKKDNTPHLFSVGGITVECYFSPSDNINHIIKKSITDADVSMYAALLLFTQQELADQIINSVNAGVAFAAILNDTSGSSTGPVIYNNLYNAAGNNIQIYQPFSNEILHHKYLICDQNTALDPMVLSGSHNWTYTAETKNDENTLVIHDAAITNQFYQEFHQRMLENGILLNIDEPASDLSIIYPVPCNNDLFITLKSDFSDVVICNIQGQVVYEDRLNAGVNKINTSAFPEGLYIIRTARADSRFIIAH